MYDLIDPRYMWIEFECAICGQIETTELRRDQLTGLRPDADGVYHDVPDCDLFWCSDCTARVEEAKGHEIEPFDVDDLVLQDLADAREFEDERAWPQSLADVA